MNAPSGSTTDLRTNNLKESSSANGQATEGVPLVLVVEDHEDTRFLLRYLIEMRGYRVAEAEDGLEAVNLAESMRPDLIVMDVTLPRLDGFSATRRIRELAILHDVPIIFLSGHIQPDMRSAALATGVNEYLIKPLRVADLERAVEKHLRKSLGVNAQ